jgi:hypothetical protein
LSPRSCGGIRAKDRRADITQLLVASKPVIAAGTHGKRKAPSADALRVAEDLARSPKAIEIASFDDQGG